MHYVKTKRAKIDTCNICSQKKSLSWDHVPPKGGVELTTMEMENLFHVFTREENIRKIRESQNGLKFRTICNDCNSFLGQHYDQVVNDFASSVGLYLKSNLTFPPLIHHKTKPLKLMKGILGHLLAAKSEYDEVTLDVQVREFILDENASVPDGIYIFYWIYPYNCTIILRDFVMPTQRGNFKNFGFFQTIKYFPVAYLVSNKPRYEGLMELTQYRNCEIDEEVEIPIQLNDIKHHYWPEMVDNGNILLAGQAGANAITAVPKKMA